MVVREGGTSGLADKAYSASQLPSLIVFRQKSYSCCPLTGSHFFPRCTAKQ